MSSSRTIIYGTVPGTTVLPAPLPEGIRVDDEEVVNAPKKRPKKPKAAESNNAWRKGYPRNTTKQDILEGRVAPIGSSRPPPEMVGMGHCVGCDNVLMAVSLPLVRELVRVARDRLAYDQASARSDVLYLAARLDGYCSLGCWKAHGPEALVKEVAP